MLVLVGVGLGLIRPGRGVGASVARKPAYRPETVQNLGIVNLVGYKARAIARQYGAERHAATWTHVSRRHTRKASSRARRY